MTESINIMYIVVLFLIVFSVLIVILWDFITGVKFIRTAALGVVAAIKIGFPLFGTVLEAIVKSFIWF